MSKSEKISDISDNLDYSNQFLHSTKVMDLENAQVYSKSDISEVTPSIQVLIEENEALRTGLHEILDSIHDQDGEFLLTLTVLFSVAHIFLFLTLLRPFCFSFSLFL